MSMLLFMVALCHIGHRDCEAFQDSPFDPCLGSLTLPNSGCTFDALTVAAIREDIRVELSDCCGSGSVSKKFTLLPSTGNGCRFEDIPPSVVIQTLCSYFTTHCGSLSCAEMAIAAGKVLGRGLTDDELAQLFACTGCDQEDCGVDPCVPDPTVCDQNGDMTYSCEDLQIFIANARACALQNNCGPLSDEDLGELICSYLQNLAINCSSMGGPADCFEAIACVAQITPITPGLIEGLVGCGACDLCKDGCELEDPANCDLDGDGEQGDCDDLRILVMILQACRQQNNCGPTTADDIAAALCDYMSECFSGGDSRCGAMLDCVIGMVGDPDLGVPADMGSELCDLLECSGCREKHCGGDSKTCATLSDLPCDVNGDGVVDGHDLDLFFIMILCCADHNECVLTEKQLADALCAFIDNCEIATCGEVAEMLDSSIISLLSVDVVDMVLECLNCEAEGDIPQKDPEGAEESDAEPATCSRGDGPAGDAPEPKAIGQTDHVRDNPADPGAPTVPPPTVRFPTHMTPSPVDLARGHKSESEADISVSFPGGSYNFTRHYTSNPAYNGASLVGHGWMASSFPFVVVTGSSPGYTLTVYGPDPSRKRTYSYVAGSPARWVTGGRALEYFESGTVALWGNTYDVWRLIAPGNGYTEYFRSTSGGAVPAEFIGLPWRSVDAYGRVSVYEYSKWGGPTEVARLRAIHLALSKSDWTACAAETTVADGMAEVLERGVAQVRFSWSYSSDADVAGKLAQVSVWRHDGTEPVETNRVMYTYKESGDGRSDDVGSSGDLIQVVRLTMLNKDDRRDPLADAHATVTQYRYYRNVEEEEEEEESPEQKGLPHQLKMVLAPEQIEYLAQNATTQTGSGWDLIPLRDRLQLYAEELMTLNDNGENSISVPKLKVQTRATPLASLGSATDITVTSAASKVIEYVTASGSFLGRVTQQDVLSGCGCSGASQGVRYTYFYTGDYDATAAEKRSTLMRESVYNSGSSTWIPYRDHLYDMEWYDGRPHVVTYCLAELGAASGGTIPRNRMWVNHYEYGKRIKKPINLPAWKKVNVDWDHILKRHAPWDSRLKNTGQDMFPDTWDEKTLKKAVEQAYESCEVGAGKAGGRQLLKGKTKDGMTIEMIYNGETKMIETAYPPRGRDPAPPQIAPPKK